MTNYTKKKHDHVTPTRRPIGSGRVRHQIIPEVAANKNFTFAQFFVVWAQQMQWKVPVIHIEIAKFLDSSDEWDNLTGVLQVFRGAGKSTIIGLFIAYMLVKNPKLRFLILSADSNTAGKITQDARNIIVRHPLALHLHGKENTWRDSKFYVNGSEDPRNPSVSAYGIMSNITGGRADFVIFDDIEVPKNAANEALREALRNRVGDTVHILVPYGKMLFVGTPHSFDSLYPEKIDAGASSLRIPLINNPEGDFPDITGTSAWDDRFPMEEVLKRQRASRTKGNFLSQYQLIPYNAEDTIFDMEQLIEYKNSINYYTANRETVLNIGKQRMVSCSCFWDPAMSGRSNDDSVIAVVFSNAEGHYFIHAAKKLVGDAETQCLQAKEFALKYHIPQITIETNGVGAFLPAILRKVVADTGIAVVGEHSTKNKAQKLLEAYEVPLSAGYLHVHSDVWQSPFLGQLRDFNPVLVGRAKDDWIDAPASAIMNEPIRITKGVAFGGTQQKWRPSGSDIELERDAVSF